MSWHQLQHPTSKLQPYHTGRGCRRCRGVADADSAPSAGRDAHSWQRSDCQAQSYAYVHIRTSHTSGNQYPSCCSSLHPATHGRWNPNSHRKSGRREKNRYQTSDPQSAANHPTPSCWGTSRSQRWCRRSYAWELPSRRRCSCSNSHSRPVPSR